MVRIEDTDQKRYVEGSEEKIFEALSWYGIDYDEGPGKPGTFGPYRQSERLAIYKDYADQLIDAGHAYFCFCSAERLELMRKEQEASKLPPRYDGLCRTIDSAAARERAVTEACVVRMKFPTTGETRFTDLIRGDIVFRNELVEDQVLIKSDGWPTYHLAAVVDDQLMEINTVIRGEEWLSSTPKHLELYRMFGWTPPAFAHMPLLLGTDRSKLSKRHGSTDALRFRDEGYLPDAMINFLALLGWSSKSDQEFFTRQELVEKFSLSAMNKAGAVFDLIKLQSINAHYLRALSPSDLARQCLPYLRQANLVQEGNEGYATADNRTISATYIERAMAVVRERLKTLADCVDASSFFFEAPEFEAASLVWKKSDQGTAISRLKSCITFFESLTDSDFTEASLEEKLKTFIETHALGT